MTDKLTQLTSIMITSTGPPSTSKSEGHTVALTVGLCLGIPALLASVGLLMFYMRRRHQKTKSDHRPNEEVNSTGSNDARYGYSTKAELPAEERPATIPEMDGSSHRDSTLKQEPTDIKKEPLSKDEVCEHKATDSSPMYELPG